MKQQPSFAHLLLSWFKKEARDLPWRHTKNPYFIWVSEMMLQQTTVATVIDFYKRWIKKYPSLKALALANEQEVLKMWQGLGYYNRAKNFHRAAKQVVEELAGNIPSCQRDLQQLPGLGPYASSAIASIAFNEKVVLIDANVRRVMMRLLSINKKISLKDDSAILKQLQIWINDCQEFGQFNEAMMELGALICRSKQPLCFQCPVHSYCKALKKGIQERIPRKETKKILAISAVVGIIKHKNKLLIQKRAEKGLWAGFWEFPGGKIKSTDGTKEEALKREVQEETGLSIDIKQKIGTATHFYTHYRVSLTAFECSCCDKNFVLKKNALWIPLKDLKKYPMPSGNVKIINQYLLKSSYK